MENNTQVATREGSVGATSVVDRNDPFILLVVSHNDRTSMMSRLTSQAASALGTALLAASKEIEPIEKLIAIQDDAIKNELERQGIR